MDIDQQILLMLQNRSAADRPLTIGDFARRFGASPQIIVGAARRLVDGHLADAYMIDVRGVPTLQGLRPLPPVATAVS